MRKSEQEAGMSVDQIHAEMMGMLREGVPGQRWVSPSQHKTWYPPTDVYETDDCVIVKVEIAGMAEEDFSIALEGNKLTISGIRRDPAAKFLQFVAVSRSPSATMPGGKGILAGADVRAGRPHHVPAGRQRYALRHRAH